MADPKQLSIIRQDKETWNKWRQQNPDIKINLSGANLSGANLLRTNLSRALLLGANLREANLTGICIEDWYISSKTNLDNVICDYIYLKKDQRQHRPSDPNKKFEPGEFAKMISSKERLYQPSLVSLPPQLK